MGLYLYGCYAPSKNVDVIVPGTGPVLARTSRYLFKPYHNNWDGSGLVETEFGYVSKACVMAMAKIEKAWANQPKPQYRLSMYEDEDCADLVLDTGTRPVIWLEEYSGCISLGQCSRRGRVWTLPRFGDGYVGADPIIFEKRYRQALTQSPSHANVLAQDNATL
jgi:hypothetical protein